MRANARRLFLPAPQVEFRQYRNIQNIPLTHSNWVTLIVSGFRFLTYGLARSHETVLL